MKYPIGTKVSVYGNDEGQIIDYDKQLCMYTVRLWQGFRHVGDVIAPKEDIFILPSKSPRTVRSF